MRLFPEQLDDLLDVSALPPTENTELNYRTRPLSLAQELRLTILLIFGVLPVVLALSVPIYLITSGGGWGSSAVRTLALITAGWVLLRLLTEAFVRREVLGSSLFALGLTGSQVWDVTQQGGDYSWPLALGIAWVASALIGQQVACWILAGPTVDHDRAKRWKLHLPQFLPRRLSLDCPELLTFYVSPVLVGAAALLTSRVTNHVWVLPWAFLCSLHLVWCGWHLIALPLVPWPSWRNSWWHTLRALVIFTTYDIYHTPAAGVFRFPVRWLRSPVYRWILLIFTLTTIGFSFAARCPGPATTWSDQGLFLRPLITNLLLISAVGPAALCGVLWLSCGTLLSRFHRELSHHKDDDTTDWDNYVDRIVNSADELERDHMFLGTSESGDYPILVHREIHDQHCHILGDSGAAKTALGIAPQVTQKIARGDCTVVVVDLKGDRALFETCRREAARTKKLKFRWLSNEVGKTTFAFNPFLQAHNDRLSVEQLTQQLLQGLSLDYGIEYGAGYFTAMNEIVLNNVLNETGSRSFRELSAHLSDRRWYASIGHEDDWKQARHLASLVQRLSASQPINVVPEMHAEQPEIHEHAIDVTDLLREPQVVYLSLRSAVEPTNAPTIARLFLWAIFTAASHQPLDKNRVYFFVDEMQQLISDGTKLIFEQFRDLGGTIIAAHQTAGQLHRQGTDLGETVDSCTAMKQVFRASDLESIERLEKLSGWRRETMATWYQRFERGTGDLTDRYNPLLAQEGLVRVTEQDVPRYNSDALLAVGARRQSSLVRFTFGSGYTQFAGATVPMVSQFHISEAEYKRRRQEPWPNADGAFPIVSIQSDTCENADPKAEESQPGGIAQKKDGADPACFASEFTRRGRKFVQDLA